MGTRQRINKKGFGTQKVNPQRDPFAPRPFANGVQPRKAELPITDLLQPRPFAPPREAPEPKEMPDWQTRMDLATRAGMNAYNLSVFAPKAKLTVGEPGDKYEQEADFLAAIVVDQINSPTQEVAGIGQTVQRDDLPLEEEEPVQAKLESGTIQRDEMPPSLEEEEEPQPVQAFNESGTIQREDMPNPEEEKPLQRTILQKPGGATTMAES